MDSWQWSALLCRPWLWFVGFVQNTVQPFLRSPTPKCPGNYGNELSPGCTAFSGSRIKRDVGEQRLTSMGCRVVLHLGPLALKKCKAGGDPVKGGGLSVGWQVVLQTSG